MFFKFCKKAPFSHLPSTFFAPSEHLLNTSRAPFEHLPSTSRAPPEHLPSTSRAAGRAGGLPGARPCGRVGGLPGARARGRAPRCSQGAPKVLPRCPQDASLAALVPCGPRGARHLAQRCSAPRPEVPRSPRKGATALADYPHSQVQATTT